MTVAARTRPALDGSALERSVAEIVAEMRELRAAIDHLVRRLDAPRRRRRLSAEDSVLLAALLPAIAGARGSAAFRVAELFAHPSTAPIVARVRGADDGTRSMRLGHLLRKVDEPIDGFTVVSCGREGGIGLWSVVTVTSG